MKKSIVCTITPNPALDLGGTADRIIPDEKTYVDNETRFPGGNGINVARILTRLKVPVLTTGFLGGATGQEIKFLLNKEGVESSFIPIQEHSRISVTVSNRKDHNQTRLSFPGPHIKSSEKQKLYNLVRSRSNISFLMLGGSLPEGITSADVIYLMRLVKRQKIESIVDFPGKILRQVIDGGPLLIKPNLDEFQQLVRRKVKRLTSVHSEARKLLDRVPYICVSSVEGGTLLVTRRDSYFGRIPKVKVRSTVGAGDSMVGAMVAQLFYGNSTAEELLRWGLAASAATLSHSGTALGNSSEIRRLYNITTVERVR